MGPSPVRNRLLLAAAALLFSTGGAAIKAATLTGWQVASFRSALAAVFLLITLPEDQVQTLLDRAAKTDNYRLTVSLEENSVHDDQGFSTTFSIDPFRRYCLLEGLDDIGLTLRHADALDRFEKQHDKEFWVSPRTQETLNA